jgi:signal transduction histidine kinase
VIPTILVVEDNTLNLELVRDVLLTAGMKVIETRSGTEGLEAHDGRARITVTDGGPGVAAEHREMIFEKFGQAPLGRTGAVRSSGLGLTFCKLAVEAHGGKIGVDSSNGGGARFWIELPRKTAPSA